MFTLTPQGLTLAFAVLAAVMDLPPLRASSLALPARPELVEQPADINPSVVPATPACEPGNGPPRLASSSAPRLQLSRYLLVSLGPRHPYGRKQEISGGVAEQYWTAQGNTILPGSLLP